MANPQLRVQITADLADIKQGMGLLRGELAKVRAEGQKTNDLFGSFGKGLGAFAGAAVSIGTLTAGLSAVARATIESEQAQSQLLATLKSSGGAVGLSADQLNRMAAALQEVTTYDDDAITGVQTLLLQFDRVGKDTFPRATEAVLNFAQRMGVDLASAAQTVGRALQDPEQGLKGLKAAGIELDAGQQKLIKSLLDVGDSAGAQKIILDELDQRMGDAARTARDTLGGSLKSAENAFGNLLEGDTGSDGIRGTVGAVNTLTATLNDPGVKQGFQSMIALMAELATFAASAAGAIGGLYQAFKDSNAANDQKTYLGLLARQRELEDLIARGGRLSKEQDPLATLLGITDSGAVEKAKKELAEINALVAQRNNLLQGRVVKPSGPQGVPATDTVTIRANPDLFGAGEDPAAKAAREKAAAEALRKQAQTTKEYQDALASLDKQLTQLALDQGGPALQAAEQYKQTMLALAEVEGTLQKQGKLTQDQVERLAAARQQAADAYQKQLADQQKAEQAAALQALQAREQAITSRLNSAGTAISAQADAGLLPQTEAEQQLQALRQTSIEQLQQLRAETVAYLQTLGADNPEAQKAIDFLSQIDTQIAQVHESQNQLAANAKNQAVQSLTNFFSDLATGAKSFKQAFRELVLSFVQGLAQMAAKLLAERIILSFLKALSPSTPDLSLGGGPGVSVGDFGGNAYVSHAGGIAGSGGTMRRVSPALFGLAPRYHVGGIAGDEVPAILRRGERVLNLQETAAYANGQGGGSKVARPVVVLGEAALANALRGYEGEDLVVTHVVNNFDRILSSTGRG